MLHLVLEPDMQRLQQRDWLGFYADIQIIFGTVYLRPELSAVESQGKAEFQKI